MNGLVPSELDEIKRRVSIVDVVGARVGLSKSGKNFKGLCPFHGEKSPSFYVFPRTESYYCFGCQESGDIISFVMATDGLEFRQALEMLGGRAGIEISKPQRPDSDAGASSAEKRKGDRLRELCAAAAFIYNYWLQKAQEGEVARTYLEKRGVTAEGIEMFQVGYSLNGWDGLIRHITQSPKKPMAADGSAFTLADMEEAGLVVPRNDGTGYYDRFRGRLMFPIRDRQGQVIAFGGRALLPGDEPKYMNSPQTPLFDKSNVLYGLDLARDGIRRTNRAVIVEGYMDVLVSHQFGQNYVVAPLGTALGEKHVNSLKRLTKNLVLALDPDAAGQAATLRSIDTLKQSLDYKAQPMPTQSLRNPIRFEQVLDADIRILELPRGKDPDELVLESVHHWRELVEKARPVIDYVFSRVTETLDLNTARGKREAVTQLAPVIKEIRDRIVREHYIQQLARRTKLDETLVRDAVEQARAIADDVSVTRENISTPTTLPTRDSFSISPQDDAPDDNYQTEAVPVAASDTPFEDYLLGFLLRYPDGLNAAGSSGEPVIATDFQDIENRAIFESLVVLVQAEKSLAELEDAVGDALSGRCRSLFELVRVEPEIDEVWLVKHETTQRLDRVREHNLRLAMQRRSEALAEMLTETEEVAAPDPDAQAWLWVNQMKKEMQAYYPKPSVLFKDSRTEEIP